MSRSRRKTPAGGCTSVESDKRAKALARRAWRRASRVAVAGGDDPPALREVSDVYDMGKDGHRWYGAGVQPADLRK